MKYILSLLLILFSAVGLSAQQTVKVAGTVTDDEGLPLPGVNILEKGTSRGVTTDIDGNYTFVDLKEGATLSFSFIGMQTEEVKVGKKTTINVQLQAGYLLDEVVAIGYGKVRKSDLAGSISTLKMDDVMETSALSVGEAMMGKVAGVNIIPNTGEPGSGLTFEIRGRTSLSGSNQPLFVIDGQPIETGSDAANAGMDLDQRSQRANSDPMANINPNDIASIEILKDASATAIYGSRGANGVVLITTKSGKDNESLSVNYSHRSDFSTIPKKLKVLNTNEYYQYLYECDANTMKYKSDYKPQFTSLEEAMELAATMPDINWQDETYNTSYSQDHQISVSGGRKNDKFLISGNYSDNNGIIKNSYYKRGGLRFNYSRSLTDKLTMNFRSYYGRTERNQIPQATLQGNLAGSAVLAALAFKPITDVVDEEGGINDGVANNPVVLREKVPDKTTVSTVILNMLLEYQITKDLSASVRGAYNDMNSTRRQYWSRGTYVGNTNDGQALLAENKTSNYLLEYLLTYVKTFDQKHHLNAVGGFTWQEWNSYKMSQISTGFPDDKLLYYNLGSAKYPGVTTTRYMPPNALASFLGRATYSYDNRYVMVLTGRYDGSRRLAKGHKWSFFPSVGLAWNISNEDFMKNIAATISNLKLRASYGVAGNSSIGAGATTSTLGLNYAVIGQSINPAYSVNSFDNPNLKWERTTQYGIGIDLSLLRSKIDFTLDLYDKITTDLLVNKTLPASATFDSYAVNAGKLTNKGIDLELNYRIIGKKDLYWSVGGNFSVMRNKVVNLGETGSMFGRSVLSHGAYSLNQSINIAQPGSVIGAFYGYKTAGVYQDWAEVLAGPDATSAHPGDVIFVDLDGDGVITENDKTIIGNPFPDFTYGFNTKFEYKGFSINAVFLGSVGNELINLNRWPMGTLNNNTGTNVFHDAWENRYQGPGTGNNVIPAPNNNSTILEHRLPDWMVEDASYFRLQSLTLGYNIKLKRGKSFIKKAKVFASGTNLFTITNYSGYDPAVSTFGDSALTPGIDLGILATPRTFSFGIDVTF